MKILSVILISLFLFAACSQSEKKKSKMTYNPAPQVIDYPAGVMIAPGKPFSSAEVHNTTIAKKILASHHIPVLGENTGQLVFVKTNGDRVSITLDELAGKYDIILFNAVNNPVPLKIADLQGAFDYIFKLPVSSAISTGSSHYEVKSFEQKPDTLTQKSARKRLSQIKRHEKKIVVTSFDTSARNFIARAIPENLWVEQLIDSRSIFKINFENDLISYANTDRYFTNGITFDLQAAWLGRLSFRKLMIPYNHSANVKYSFSMVQDMYTPTDTRIAPALAHDRPYSSYLYFGFRKTTSDPVRKIKIANQVDAGYIGPASPGSYLQTLVHKTFPTNDVPLGWETQIKTDIILNYAIHIQKALASKENMSLLGGFDLNAGTLHTDAGAGFQLQAGKAEPVFGLKKNEKWPRAEYYFFAKTNISIVAYNALLQGGMFNHDNIFTLKGNEIQRVVGNAEVGIHARYKGVGIELAQHYLSPEYKGGMWHQWGRISLLFGM
ncbi:MAG: lipid A deacylase LpxR family protein [Bacteroidota bacterium]